MSKISWVHGISVQVCITWHSAMHTVQRSSLIELQYHHSFTVITNLFQCVCVWIDLLQTKLMSYLCIWGRSVRLLHCIIEILLLHTSSEERNDGGTLKVLVYVLGTVAAVFAVIIMIMAVTYVPLCYRDRRQRAMASNDNVDCK